MKNLYSFLKKTFDMSMNRAFLLRDASERFDKRVLLQLHDDFESVRREAEGKGKGSVEIRSSFTDPGGSGGAACSVPLEKLNPISFNELKVGEVHDGRVVHGTLCADAKRIWRGIMTLLEDDNGLAVRLAIYNATSFREDIKRLYPRGAKVAAKEPYFKIAGDGGFLIHVDNPTNLVNLVSEKRKRTENLLHVDVEEARQKGNRCFRLQNWEAATENYTRCIDAALLQLKKRSSGDNNNINTCLLHAYSNRAETRFQEMEFELALEDSDKALGLDSSNLKALYTKGRALVGLRQYAGACEFLQKADKATPGQKEIQDALRRAKTLYAQSQNGKYDISDFLLGFGPPPKVVDFVGPVEIKMSENGRGRGLYATREISTGQLLLVSNAVAVVYEDDRSTAPIEFNVDHRVQLDIVIPVICAAMKSQTLLRQLYSLAGSSKPGSLHVPAIDLFKTDSHMSRSQEEEKEKLQVDVECILDIISRNSFSGGEQASKSKIYKSKRFHEDKYFTGLWLLPSFINHSCLPNSSTMAVGSALFIHASKPIKQGEEISISYFDTIVPLPQRQAKCKNWGFKCNCRRCILELSLRTFMEPINTRFEELHAKALEEFNAAYSQKRLEADLPASAEFAKISVEVEKIIKNFPEVIKTVEEKQWIRASFVSAYLARMNSSAFFPTTLDGVPFVETVIQAIQNAVPADIRTLIMAAQQFKKAQRWMGDTEYAFEECAFEQAMADTEYAFEQAREACIRVFGKHSEDVIKALVLKYSN